MNSHNLAWLQLYTEICDTLRNRKQNHPANNAFSWIRDGMFDAVALPISEDSQQSYIEIWLGKDTDSGEVTKLLRASGYSPNFVLHSFNRPSAQAASIFNDTTRSGMGTVACLARDRLHNDRYYVLTCGHVLGGALDSGINDPVIIEYQGTNITASLTDWEPSIGDDIPRTGIDAAIAEISSDDYSTLSTIRTARGVSSTYRYDQDIILKSGKDILGKLRTRWSGYVDIEGNERGSDYYLENAVGYRTESSTNPGDSGAAIWDAITEDLLGIHVGAPIGNEQWRSNAVFCPIDRIMDWFDIEPISRDSGVILTPLSNRIMALPTPAHVNANSDEEILVVAKTIWGEARGEGEQGMRAVACVIGNRAKRRWQGKIGFAAICTAYKQFSCWNETDPNRHKLDLVSRNPDAEFNKALEISKALITGQLPDETFGATHYFAANMRAWPNWARGKRPCFELKNHVFFNEID